MLRLPDFYLVSVSYFIAGIAMMVPAIVSLIDNEHSISQTFFYCGLLVIVFSIIIGLASRNLRQTSFHVGRLIELVVIFITLPAILALPFYLATEFTSQIDAYFEMVSCLSTTGASLLYQPTIEGTSQPSNYEIFYAVDFWRAQVAWMGGLLIWIAAAEILSPLGVGGFEIIGQRQPEDFSVSMLDKLAVVRHRFRGIWILSISYTVLTVMLWLLMIGAGDSANRSLIVAMATISTSGITIDGGYSTSSNSLAGEFFTGAFLILALSRVPVLVLRWGPERIEGVFDREIRLAFYLILVVILISLYFQYEHLAAMRTWQQLVDILLMLWGIVFSTISFLSTTGFQSIYWNEVQEFHPNNFVVFMLSGLALIGGGVATTAGGLKLLRIDGLLSFGLSELERLAYPSIIITEKIPNGGYRGERTVLAGVFLMLFLVMLALCALIFALLGREFEEAIVLSISSITNTGPLANASLGEEFSYSQLTDIEKILLCLAMIIGRLELLALITLISPNLWYDVKSKVNIDNV